MFSFSENCTINCVYIAFVKKSKHHEIVDLGNRGVEGWEGAIYQRQRWRQYITLRNNAIFCPKICRLTEVWLIWAFYFILWNKTIHSKKTVCSLLHQLNVSGCWLFLDNESVIIDNIFLLMQPLIESIYFRLQKNK